MFSPPLSGSADADAACLQAELAARQKKPLPAKPKPKPISARSRVSRQVRPFCVTPCVTGA
jgi:hypothetical protein